MNNSDDVLKQLEVKNREIYINKLNIDLDNNNEIVLLTINNIINLFTEESINKILELDSKSISKENIEKIIKDFYNKLNNEIQSLLNNRLNNLKAIIVNINDIDYQEVINKERKNVIDGIKDSYSNGVDKLISEIDKNNPRIENYLRVLNYERLVNKLKELLDNVSTILYNSYIESNNKYQELNAKTLNR